MTRTKNIKPWGSIDTETVNRSGHGEACLLVSSWAAPLIFPRDWDEIFNYLEGRSLMAYNLDFDARAILHEHFVDWEALEELALTTRLKWRGYAFHYVPSKHLTVRRGRRDFFRIFDLAQYFDCSLDEAAREHLRGARKSELPRHWYNQINRRLRDPRTAPTVLRYAQRDVELCERLRVKMFASFGAVGINCNRPVSSGALAMQKFGPCLQREGAVAHWINREFEQAFFGGRIETRTLGRTGKVRLYDLHSAYPSEIARLKTRCGARLIKSDAKTWRYSPQVRYGVYRSKIYCPDRTWGPLAVRDGIGRISYPVGEFTAWHCLPALRSLKRAGIRFEVQRALEFSGGENRLIFKGLQGLYRARKNPILGLAAKKVSNSIYGKLAESRAKYEENEIAGARFGNWKLTSRPIWGRFTNFVLAAHITEGIRMRLWEELERQGERAHFCATDSILTEGRIKAGLGKGMGQWGFKGEYDESVILGCGRYILRRGRKREIHLRGFDLRRESFAKLRESRRGACVLSNFGTGTLKDWARGRCLQNLNVLSDRPKVFRIEDRKRYWFGGFKQIRFAFRETLKSKPWFFVG